MTNKQTIDGVSRDLVERVEDLLASPQHHVRAEYVTAYTELRAILDAQYAVCSNGILCQNSKCAECGGNGAYKPAAWERDMDYRPEELDSPETEPAAQPQGEVERLRIDLELTKLARQSDQIEIDGLKALNDGLRAQLAERDGLLRLIREQPMLNQVHRARINTVLSTSAEPKPQSDQVACVIAFRCGVKEPELLSWNQLPNGEHRLYAEQPAPLASEAAKTFAKGFNTLESGGGKYRINMQFQSREDAWGAFSVLARLKQLNTPQ